MLWFWSGSCQPLCSNFQNRALMEDLIAGNSYGVKCGSNNFFLKEDSYNHISTKFHDY
jgi:hypothetical protein